MPLLFPPGAPEIAARLQQGLAGWWPCDAATLLGKTAYDRTPYRNHGALTGGARTAGSPFGLAVVLDGTNDYVKIRDHTIFNLAAAGSYTWAMWIKPTTFREWSAVWGQMHTGGGLGLAFYAHTSANANMGVTAGLAVQWLAGTSSQGLYVHSTSNVLTLNQWAHVALTYTGTLTQTDRFVWYVNGRNVTDTADVVSTFALVDLTPAEISIGLDNLNYSDYGVLSQSDIRFYTRALPVEDVRALYIGGLTSAGRWQRGAQWWLPPLAEAVATAVVGQAALLQDSQASDSASALLLQGQSAAQQAAHGLSSASTVGLTAQALLSAATQASTSAGALALGGQAAIAQATQSLAASSTLPLSAQAAVAQPPQILVSTSALALAGQGVLSASAQTSTSVSTLALAAQGPLGQASQVLSSATRLLLTATAAVVAAPQVSAASATTEPAFNLAVAFTTTVPNETVTIAGPTHGMGHGALRVQVYDTATPRQRIFPAISVDASPPYDVRVTCAQPQSGLIVLNGARPPAGSLGNRAFVFPMSLTWSVPGTLHGYGTANLLIDAYDASTPRVWLPFADVTVHQGSFDITLTWLQPQAGMVVLCAASGLGTPNTSTALVPGFPLTIPGATHGLGTANLGAQVYDPSGDEVSPAQVTVDPASFDVVVTCLQPQAGRVVLNGSLGEPPPALTGTLSATQAPQGSTSASTLALAAQAVLAQGAQAVSGSALVALTGTSALTQTAQMLTSLGSGLLFLAGRFDFASSLTVLLPSTAHGLATHHLLIQTYDAGLPWASQIVGDVSVHPSSYDVQVDFVQAQPGYLLVSATTHPAVGKAFTATDSVLFTGVEHGRGTPNLLVQVVDTTGARMDAQVRVHQTSYDVEVTLEGLTSGRVIVASAAPAGPPDNPAKAFSAAPSVSFSNAEHALGSPNVLVQLYDAGTPTHVFLAPTSVDPSTYAVTAAFVQTASGLMVVGGGGAVGSMGSLSATQAAQIGSGVGALLVQGAAGLPQQSQTGTSTGSVAVAAILTPTQAAQASSSTGQVLVRAQTALSQASQVVSSAGSLGVHGTAGLTQAGQAVAATTMVSLVGSVAVAQSAQSSSSTARLALAGSVSGMLGADVAFSQATLLVRGGLTASQESQSLLSTGLLLVQAQLLVTQEAQSGSSTAVLALAGSVVLAQADQGCSSTTTLATHASFAQTQDAQTLLSSAGTEGGLLGSLGVTQAGQGLVSLSTLALVGSSLLTQAAHSLTSLSGLGVLGASSLTQASDGLASTGALAVQGASSLSQASQTVASTSTVRLVGAAVLPQAAHSLASVARLLTTSQVSAFQASQQAQGQGALLVQATVGVTQAPQALTSLGTSLHTGQVSAAQTPQQAVSTAGLLVRASLGAASQADSLVSAGGLLARGSVLALQQGQTLDAAGLQLTLATALLLQADQAVTSAAFLVLAGVLVGLQDAQALAAVAVVPGEGHLAALQADQVLSAEGAMPPPRRPTGLIRVEYPTEIHLVNSQGQIVQVIRKRPAPTLRTYAIVKR